MREAFTLYIAGSGAKSVARTLNQRGMRTRAGDLWSKSRVTLLLGEEALTGTVALGAAQGRPATATGGVALAGGPADHRRRDVVVGAEAPTGARAGSLARPRAVAAEVAQGARVVRRLRRELPVRDERQAGGRRAVHLRLLQLPKPAARRQGGVPGLPDSAQDARRRGARRDRASGLHGAEGSSAPARCTSRCGVEGVAPSPAPRRRRPVLRSAPHRAASSFTTTDGSWSRRRPVGETSRAPESRKTAVPLGACGFSHYRKAVLPE